MEDRKSRQDGMVKQPFFRVWLCGAFRVERDAGETYQLVRTSEWGGSSYPRLLLKALLCCPGRQARREALIEMLWPDCDFEQGAQNLNTATTKLRKVLQPTRGEVSLLVTENDSTVYQLKDQRTLWVDVDEALAQLKEAELLGCTSREACHFLENVADYFNKGILLDGEEGQWAFGKRATIERAHYRCRFWLAKAYEQQGMLGQAEMVISALLEDDPLDEDAICCLMELLRQQGMVYKALRLYAQTCDVLAKEGIEPTEAIRQFATQLVAERYQKATVPSDVALFPQHILKSKAQDIPEIAANALHDSRLPHMLYSKNATTFSSANTFVIPAMSRFAAFGSTQPLFIDEKTAGTLGYFVILTNACRYLSEGNDLQTAERTLWAYLPRVETIAKLSFEDQRAAATIASQGYLLAASLAGHRNDLQARHRYSEQALLYGKLAGDRNLQIAALRQLAITFDYLGHPDSVLQIYQQTIPYLNDVSPLLRACIYADISGSYTQLQRQQEAERYLGMAYEHFPEDTVHEPDYLSTICRYSTLVLCEGLNHLAFGQAHQAENIFARIDGLQPKITVPERIRIDLLNCQVETFLSLRKMDQACIYLKTAVKVALAIGSERRFQEASTLFQQMSTIWHHEQQVQQLADLFVR